MKFENTKTFNFDGAFRGMRNPLSSWSKSDSNFSNPDKPYIGTNDMNLAVRLIKGGSEHRKFLRQIFVSVDITAPLYWWKEFDTYKVGTVANSTSTMHTVSKHPIDMSCFETDDITDCGIYDKLNVYIDMLEELRQKYLDSKDPLVWKELIRWLPSSWLQTRTVTMNYENLRSIYHQRENHKLNEWSGKKYPDNKNFCDWVKTLPYANELIIDTYKE